MAKARKLGMKTGFTPNSQADRLRSDKAYRRGRKAERKYQQNAAAKSDLAKLIAALDAAISSIPTHITTPTIVYPIAIEGNFDVARKENPYEANRCL